MNIKKQMIIKNETEWIEETQGDDEVQMYVKGMIDEINECSCIDDLIDFYIAEGLSMQEGFEAIIMLLRENTQVKEQKLLNKIRILKYK